MNQATTERLLQRSRPVRLQRRASFFYCERCVVTREEGALAIEDADGAIEVPASTLTALLLGPGTRISQSAIALLADSGCTVAWTGEDGVRLYAFGTAGAESARNAIVQAQMCSDDYARMVVAKRMLRLRFGWDLDEIHNLRQVRGREGAAVKRIYQECAREFGVAWKGRQLRSDGWDILDPPNRALSAANACLNALAHTAIVALGYVPSLGFIHTGQRHSFVYDVADMYKHRLSIPTAFQEVARGEDQLERRVRIAMRDRFRASGFLGEIVKDLQALFEPIPRTRRAGQELAEWLS